MYALIVTVLLLVALPTRAGTLEWAKANHERLASATVIVECNALVVKPDGTSVTISSWGTGVVISRLSIITAYHVVDGCKMATVHYKNGMNSSATLSGTDKDNDIARLTPLEFPVGVGVATIDLTVPEIGEDVYVISHPNGLTWTLSVGHVSYPTLRVSSVLGKERPLIQANVPIYPGSSGAGLYNTSGELVGIASGCLPGSSFSFFTPSKAICNLVNCKEVRRAR